MTKRTPGLDPYQEQARRACGIPLPKQPVVDDRKKVVDPIVVLECERCGCTSARVVGAKDKSCPFCGAKVVMDTPAQEIWHMGGRK
jgi:rubrerythrin